jgi:hypothetical protein
MKDRAPLAIKVKMDGAGWYRFGLAREQSVHEIVYGDTGCSQWSGKYDDRDYYR